MRSFRVVQDGSLVFAALGLAFACDSGAGLGDDGSSGGVTGATGGTSSASGGRLAGGGTSSATGSQTGIGGSQTGSGGQSDQPGGEANSSGGSESGSGGELGALGGTFFSDGSRAVIPHVPLGVYVQMTPELTNGAMGLVAPTVRIVSAPEHALEHDFGVSVPYLFDKTNCEGNGVAYGAFEVDSIEVDEDIDNSGAHFTLLSIDDVYKVKHDGLGQHRLHIEGRFVATNAPSCSVLFNSAGELPMTFDADVRVEVPSSVQLSFRDECTGRPKILSGQQYPLMKIELLDQDGKVFYPANASSEGPLDVVIETEREAEIGTNSAGFAHFGVTITGESQLIRLSTSVGELGIHRLVVPGDVEDWDLEFWSEERAHGVIVTQIETGHTYPAIELRPEAIGADLQLFVGGEALCSLNPYEDFVVRSTTPNVCGPAVGPGGHLALMLESTGTCAFNVAYPPARGGQGLEFDFTTTYTLP